MNFRVNANMGVRVRLTDYGISILKERHDRLNESIKENNGVGLGDFELKLDENGYYHTQLWILMSIFGDVIGWNGKNPFDLDIIIENGEPIES